MITFSCTSCGRTLRIANEASGKQVRCPSCTTVLTAPRIAASESAAQDLGPSGNLGSHGSSTANQDSNPWSLYIQQPIESAHNSGDPNPYTAHQANSNYSSLPASNNPMGLIFGILSIMSAPLSLCCVLLFPIGFVTGIIAWVVSHHERKKIEAGIVAPSGVIQAGYILGIIGTILSLVILLFGVAYFAISIFMAIQQNQGNF